MRILVALWRDEAGLIVSAELVVVGSLAVVGLVAGLTSVQQSVDAELHELATTLRSFDQSVGMQPHRCRQSRVFMARSPISPQASRSNRPSRLPRLAGRPAGLTARDVGFPIGDSRQNRTNFPVTHGELTGFREVVPFPGGPRIGTFAPLMTESVDTTSPAVQDVPEPPDPGGVPMPPNSAVAEPDPAEEAASPSTAASPSVAPWWYGAPLSLDNRQAPEILGGDGQMAGCGTFGVYDPAGLLPGMHILSTDGQSTSAGRPGPAGEYRERGWHGVPGAFFVQPPHLAPSTATCCECVEEPVEGETAR